MVEQLTFSVFQDGLEYNKINTAATEYRNVIKGVEFQTYDYGIFPSMCEVLF